MSTPADASRAGPRPAPRHRLKALDRELELGARPCLMGTIEAVPASSAGGGARATLEPQLRRAQELLGAGAGIIELVTDAAAAGSASPAAGETLIALIEALAGEPGATVSLDVHEPELARAAVAAGAAILGDSSGTHNAALAALCADSGAALVISSAPALGESRLQAENPHGDAISAIVGDLRAEVALAAAAGVTSAQILLDPGPAIAGTAAPRSALSRQLEPLQELQLPLLMSTASGGAGGADTERARQQRLGRALAALVAGVEAGAHVFRVEDVAAASDFLLVRAALGGEHEPSRDLALAEELRHDRPSG